MKRTLPVIITMTVGFLIIFRDLFNFPEYTAWATKYIVMGNTLSLNVAVALGVTQLVRLHFRKAIAKREGWYYSVVLLFCVFAMLAMGFIFPQGQNAAVYQWWYNTLPMSMSQAMFAMISYYIASAAYRAFRMRNMEATLLLIAAVLVMMGSVTAGYALWPRFPELKTWIMDNLNTAAMRGLRLGITLGSLAQFARNLFGIERGYMGGD